MDSGPCVNLSKSAIFGAVLANWQGRAKKGISCYRECETVKYSADCLRRHRQADHLSFSDNIDTAVTTDQEIIISKFDMVNF